MTDALRIEQVGKYEGASMSAGAGVMVIGWFTGYKVGGIITLFIADYIEKLGIQNFWQFTFLLLTIIIISCNIFLMFFPKEDSQERQTEQKQTDECIISKLGSSSSRNNLISCILGTITGPFISFFKSKGIKIGIYII